MSNSLEDIYKRICKLTGEKPLGNPSLEKEIGRGLDKLEKQLNSNRDDEEENSRRISEILKVVIYLANLRYDKKARISEKKDHFDALALGINMLGEELKASTISLHEKEVLLKEIHHRVKNNLQVISSLLNLQSEKIKQPDLLETFMESQNRIRAMALVHEKLYQSNDLSQIDFTEYMNSFSIYMNSAYNLDPNNVQIQLDADPKPHLFKIDTAIPCSLILNELISNSCKYAFPDKRKGSIRLYFVLEKETEKTAYYLLKVSDDGIGISPDIDIKKTNSLGLQLVDMLTQQIEGSVELDRDHGTCFSIRFPIHKN
jgi:two-component sensor histidine kinase